MDEPAFAGLRLVGGTALALGKGHRKSIDIDLFGSLELDNYELAQKLNEFGKATLVHQTQNIHVYIVNNIKVDLVNYPYPWLEEAKTIEGIRLAQNKDIAAMKLAAITSRGTKKDFIDLYFLFQNFSLQDMISFYEQKYSDGSVFLVLKSLTYFEDADRELSPLMLQDVDWEGVKHTLVTAVKEMYK